MDRVLKIARALWETSGRSIATPKLNTLVHAMFEKRQPRYQDNKRFKAYYTVQVSNRPFTFRIFCNRATKLDEPYRRYLQKGFIKHFKLDGCPIFFDLKGKEQRFATRERKGRSK